MSTKIDGLTFHRAFLLGAINSLPERAFENQNHGEEERRDISDSL